MIYKCQHIAADTQPIRIQHSWTKTQETLQKQSSNHSPAESMCMNCRIDKTLFAAMQQSDWTTAPIRSHRCHRFLPAIIMKIFIHTKEMHFNQNKPYHLVVTLVFWRFQTIYLWCHHLTAWILYHFVDQIQINHSFYLAIFNIIEWIPNHSLSFEINRTNYFQPQMGYTQVTVRFCTQICLSASSIL